MVTSIGAHEDERGRVGRGAGECTQVADGMAGRVEEVEGSVAEEVKGIKAAGLQTRIKGDLVNRPPLNVAVEHARVGIPGPPWPRCGADARSDDELRAGRERGRIPDVVEVVVRPDHGFDVGAADVKAAAVRVEDRRHVRSRRDRRRGIDERHNLRRVVLPVTADAQVEYDVAVAIGDQEAVDRCTKTGETLQLGLQEELWVQVKQGVTTYRARGIASAGLGSRPRQ